ncbi:unnamed protein product [Bemisia tabaci]|uniref:MSP domain-containing protein n=1 Tax=Bemisia tabaci TaxID=7038 RepID=A0A9P0C9K0_BEMTA|nr:unnamed protein product [Bemisia tabaci]
MQPRDGKVPFFVFPSSLTFYLEDRTSHKQILTLYNPYEFPIRFKVLCTRSKNYSVVDSEGLIKSLNRIDIVVRHNAPTIANCGVIDKFRIQMIDATTRQVIGKKDVIATLISEKQSNQINNGEIFKNIPLHTVSHRDSFSYRSMPEQSQALQYSSSTPNIEVILIAIACIIILLLPTEGLSFFPQLQISVNFKLICSYVLGLLTMVVLRPH